MAKVKCPYCDGEGAEPVMCHTRFPCPHCMGEGEIDESKLKEVEGKVKARTSEKTRKYK
jgi:DnaJ-class molecular chaperone